jgi:hypothetical protein
VRDDARRLCDEWHRRRDDQDRLRDEADRVPDDQGRLRDEQDRVPDEQDRVPDEQDRVPDEQGRLRESTSHAQPIFVAQATTIDERAIGSVVEGDERTRELIRSSRRCGSSGPRRAGAR